MNLLMITGDRGVASGRPCAFFHTLQGLSPHFGRIDVLCPRVAGAAVASVHGNVFLHPSPWPLVLQSLWIVRKGRALVAEHGHGAMTAQEYPPFYNGIGAAVLSRKTGVPLCLEVHHVAGWPRAADAAETVGRTLSRLMLPLLARRAAAVRVVNRTARDLLARWGVAAARLHVVPSFYLDAGALTPADTAPTVDLAFCARLVPNKGLLRFLEALTVLPGTTAVVIGDGPLRPSAEHYCASHGLTNRVRFTGWLPAGGQIAELKKARALVMCSLSEGGPRVVLEAMACAVPVIATPVGIVPEIVNGENGLLTTGTAADIALKAKALLADDAKRAALGQAARPAVLPRFDRNTTLPAYAAFLSSLA